MPSNQPESLFQTLEVFLTLTEKNPYQEVVRQAENSVMHWIRVAEKKSHVPPRVEENGFVPGVFHFGIEPRINQRMDGFPLGHDLAAYELTLSGYLQSSKNSLDQYFSKKGYRSSSDHCDVLMVELEGFSRFLSTALYDGETGATRLKNSTDTYLIRVREGYFLWEPLINEIIVAWEQNSLSDFEKTLKALLEIILLPVDERSAHIALVGYPLRPLGQPRQKTWVFSPPKTKVRLKSMLSLRFSQLLTALHAWDDAMADQMDELEWEVHHLNRMIKNNYFMLSGAPGFWAGHRSDMTVIRGHQKTHPFFIDPTGFFKKAVLFHNRTYTQAGGGLEHMFLQLRQLHRFYKFNPKKESLSQKLVAATILNWEENRWSEFTEGLLALAEIMRKNLE